MPQRRLPGRPLAMRLLLWRRLQQKNESEPSAATAHASTIAMSLETFERTVRMRARAFFRNTRLVGIVGAIILAGLIWAALHSRWRRRRCALRQARREAPRSNSWKC
jgi:hypothetical protein